MERIELTLDRSVDNIALDEAILETAENQPEHPEILRLWEPKKTMVVVGRSSPIEQEVDLSFCRRNDIDVFRRCSGGASIVTGPGCLMYAVLLDYRKREPLRMLDNAHRFVMAQIRAAIARLNIEVSMQGTCDLTIDDKKFSGNALRCKRNWMIYHGTILCDFDLQKISDCLGDPKRQPEYRDNRNHKDFLTLLPTDTKSLRAAIIDQWSANEPFDHLPMKLTRELAQKKYLTDEWTFKVR